MSVSLRNRTAPSSAERAAPEPKGKSAAENRTPFEQVEKAFHVVLALTIVGGLALMLGRGAPTPEGVVGDGGVIVARPRVAVSAAPGPAKVADDPLLAVPAIAKTPSLMAAFSAMPANAPEPLSPPTTELRKTLQGGQSPKGAAAGAPEPALAYASAAGADKPALPSVNEVPKAGDEASRPGDEARTSKCSLKLGGRAESSPCRIRDDGDRVTVGLPGRTLALSRKRGRSWTATLDGRVIGKAYRRGACWSARRLHLCENG
jgi:hypothetical protein